MMKTIAIIGAGLAGLAVAYHILNKNQNCTVTLFDQKGIAAGASGIAAGLLHPFVGARSKRNFEADEVIGYSSL